MNSNGWIDITMPLISNMVVWQGDDPVRILRTSRIEKQGVNITKLSMGAHSGTHIDAPLHFIKGGKDISRLDLDQLIGYTKIFHITDPQQITFSELKELPIEEGDRILFRTRNSDFDWLRRPFLKDYVYLSTNAAQYLVKLGVRCIGVDYLSVAGLENGTEVHELLLNADVAIIEGLNLQQVRPGLYEMVALLLKIKGADGAPARVVVRRIEPGEDQNQVPV